MVPRLFIALIVSVVLVGCGTSEIDKLKIENNQLKGQLRTEQENYQKLKERYDKLIKVYNVREDIFFSQPKKSSGFYDEVYK